MSTTKELKPIPKSLHTVTVLVRVATLLKRLEPYSNETAVDEVLELLGYCRLGQDQYKLAAQAVRVLEREGC